MLLTRPAHQLSARRSILGRVTLLATLCHSNAAGMRVYRDMADVYKEKWVGKQWENEEDGSQKPRNKLYLASRKEVGI